MPGMAPQQPVQQQPQYPQYQQPQYYQGQQAGLPPPQKKPDETLALVSLLLSIGSFVTGLLILLSIPGVIIGHMAMKRIRTEPDSYGGEGMAKAGLIVGWINVSLSILIVLATIFAIVFPFCVACVGMLGVAATGG